MAGLEDPAVADAGITGCWPMTNAISMAMYLISND